MKRLAVLLALGPVFSIAAAVTMSRGLWPAALLLVVGYGALIAAYVGAKRGRQQKP